VLEKLKLMDKQWPKCSCVYFYTLSSETFKIRICCSVSSIGDKFSRKKHF
jgi:hypothetical protein